MGLPFKGKSHAQLSNYKAGSSSWAGAIQKSNTNPTTYMETLFWLVPLTIYLALTKKHGKAERMWIMWNTGCTEAEGANNVKYSNYIIKTCYDIEINT